MGYKHTYEQTNKGYKQTYEQTIPTANKHIMYRGYKHTNDLVGQTKSVQGLQIDIET